MTPTSVLVVDDETDSADSLGLLLDLEGFHTIVCHSAVEALAAIDRDRPQAAMVDLAMPEVSGFEFVKRLRNTAWGAQMRLIAITGLSRQSDREAARNAGFDHLLLKPATFEQLLEALSAGTVHS